jgi:N-glycosylase/DNA lyase
MPKPLKTKHILADAAALDLQKTFSCGQCFRWETDESGVWRGVAFGRSLRLWTENGSVVCDAPEAELPFWRRYFDLETDYAAATALFTQPDYLRVCADFGQGIRILRQEPWEALVSFILSQCNNIPRIRKIVSALCAGFGDALADGQFGFPSAERLAPLGEADLAPLRCGYRAAYILNAARAVAEGRLDFEALAELPPEAAFAQVKQIPGIGDKVANCFLLYGLHRMERFPIDVWMRRALDQRFPKDFDPAALGAFAGLAQQYIFYYARAHEGRDGFACA